MSTAQAVAERRLPCPPAAAPGREWLTDARIDAAERLLVLALYFWLAGRLLYHWWFQGQVGNLLLLPSEGLVVLFMLIRRRANEVSRRPGEWLLALGATCAPMLVQPGDGTGPVPPAVGIFFILFGTIIQLHAKVALGRSMGMVPANRGLRLAGPYRFVRHPMYAGYLLGHLGFLLMNPTWWNLAVYALCYGLQVPRLLAEERLLSRDPGYREYRAKVRYRLVPGIF
ncbi:MAG TPA: isoprenylcysteine carboxylmethyltransferase family protein [Gemmataceae bacterium]|nr:isoprenylcysteine carboxylmethyltransferase family protein [Gemmataceae bacterium]